ncbi:galactose mutarotase-like protein [Aspergillus heteromorphus CBS 117.55]|uniref:rhamnogalacturonan endolyase n=1 Tax=Aspergillus heteromorphus CBS 117.55 TaxID=1448321 RepID=A0A317V2A0_9EURO|nr:galactose mutarotase-like protein [Aspergillus heteromorphus CBS 117.55]PWY68403.1 galactose mutarotase-like protein [Aspergillus heteromorphus CBS 117.55]
MRQILIFSVTLFWPALASTTLRTSQNGSTITLANERITALFAKNEGRIVDLYLDGQDLLGPQSGDTGVGPYLDCYCIPSGFYTPGSVNSSLQLLEGTDVTGTKYGGVIMDETYPATGQHFQQYWFLRDGETGLHTFSRLSYYNDTASFLRNLQEFRTLFRPNTDLWTHLTSSDVQTAPLPSQVAIDEEVVVQDATWTLNNTPNDPYYTQFSAYFTKYTFSNAWRDNSVHGLYADGTTSNGTAYGAWLVMNTKGPLHSDLTVDGIVYNYLVSNHHGEGTPNITYGFDRTFGPQYYYFNGGKGSASLEELRSDAESLADPNWNLDFYDSIAKHVVGYAPTTRRGSVQGHIVLPEDATKSVAVLTVDGHYFQDNSVDSSSYQYWAEIDEDGRFSVDHVIEGNYRLTVYADGVFGDFERDGLQVQAGRTTTVKQTWVAESAGIEIWRLGTPDKSSGEFRHGIARDPTHPLHPPEYLIFWGAYDWQRDFPEGINYTIGSSDPTMDLNTVHWSVFGPTPNDPEVEYNTTHDWTINFPLRQDELQQRSTATLTIQLAGAKAAPGNTDVYDPAETYNNLALESYINDQEDPLTLLVGFNQSSSCIVRSAVSCYQVRSRMQFPADWLKVGNNVLTLHLPYNATDTETAVLPATVYVQYDALRLELS